MMAGFLMLMVILAGCVLPIGEETAHAVEPRYTNTRRTALTFDIDSAGKAMCVGEVYPYEDDTVITISLKLKEKIEGRWVTLVSWSTTGSGTSGVTLEKTVYVYEGSYKLFMTATATGSDGTSDTISMTSSEKTYP